MRTSEEIDQFTALDRSILEDKDAYATYFREISALFSLVMESINEKTTDENFERTIIQDYLQRFLHTLELLRMRYLYDEEMRMKIDLTDSCFPNFLELKNIDTDSWDPDKLLQSVPPESVLKQSIVDFIFKQKAVPQKLLKQLGKRKYAEALEKKQPFHSFNDGKYSQLQQKGDLPTYLYHWAMFDSKSNRPFVYIMLFDHESADTEFFKDTELMKNLRDYIRKSSSFQVPLRVLASDIDHQFNSIHPKIIKRIEIGPFYGHMAKDKHPFTHMLKTQFDPSDWIVEFTTELIFSVGQRRAGGFLSSGDLREIFFIDETSKECIDRNVSKVLRYMIAPHEVVTFLREHNKSTMDDLAIPPFIYNSKTMSLYA